MDDFTRLFWYNADVNRKLTLVLSLGFVPMLWAEGISGAPPPDDGRAAYLARPWSDAARRDAATDAYEVCVDGRHVPLHTADVDTALWCAKPWGDEYFFGSFPVGRSVRVRVRAKVSLADVRVLLERQGLSVRRLNDNEIELTIDRPMRLAVEPSGRTSPLMLFADPPERDVPRPGDANVIWFGPGYHEVGKISVGSNQTLYLAPEAVVSGGVEIRGTNVTIRGRGILDGRAYHRFKGPTFWMFDFVGCRGVRVEGIVCRNPYNWVLSFLDCEDVCVENFKLCGGRMINDDAVDICNCRRFVLRNSFFRCFDDVIAVKGNLPFDAKMTPVEDVLVEDCEAWTDMANVFRIGFECNASYFKSIRARRIDVLHAAANYRDVTDDWANCVFYLQPANDMTMEDLSFEDIRIRGEGPLALFSAYCHAWGCRCQPYRTAGRLRNVRLWNVSVTGNAKTQVLLRGDSSGRDIAGVAFENVTVGDRPLQADSPGVSVGPFVSGIVFSGSSTLSSKRH